MNVYNFDYSCLLRFNTNVERHWQPFSSITQYFPHPSPQCRPWLIRPCGLDKYFLTSPSVLSTPSPQCPLFDLFSAVTPIFFLRERWGGIQSFFSSPVFGNMTFQHRSPSHVINNLLINSDHWTEINKHVTSARLACKWRKEKTSTCLVVWVQVWGSLALPGQD